MPQETTTLIEDELELLFEPYAPLGTLPLTYMPGKKYLKENQVRACAAVQNHDPEYPSSMRESAPLVT